MALPTGAPIRSATVQTEQQTDRQTDRQQDRQTYATPLTIVGARDSLTILEPTHSEQLTMSDRERMPDSARGGTHA